MERDCKEILNQLNDCSNIYMVEPEKNLGFILRFEDLTMKEPKDFEYTELYNQFIHSSVHPDDQEQIIRILDLKNLISIFKNGKEKYDFLYRTKNDLIKYFSVTCIKCSKEDEPLKIGIGFREEKDFAEENDFFAGFDELDIFKALSSDYTNVYLADLNRGVAKILKYSTHYLDDLNLDMNKLLSYRETYQKWLDNVVYKEDRQKLAETFDLNHLREYFKHNKEYIGDFRDCVDGKVVNNRFHLIKMNDEGGILIGFQNIDSIIEQHFMQEKKERELEEAYQKQLIAAKEQADRANASKTEFLLRMSHDIRTPINGIMGMLDIEDRNANDFDKLKDCRKKIRDASKILLDLINEILDMSKLESGEIYLEHIPFDLVSVCTEVYYAVKNSADDRGITIIQENCSVKSAKLIGSPVHLKRLMMNIVGNAIKYNKDHGKIFITCIERDSSDTRTTLEFKCQDTGIGMSPEFLEHIFEPFTQEDTSSRTQYAGTGLGMSIAKSLVDKMGGTITVESEKGKGTTFDVLIPFDVDQSLSKKCDNKEAEDTSSIQGLKILLAEDNDLNMEVAKVLLEDEGAEVIEAWNGQEAFDLYQSEDGIDLILMDVMMPVMDGYEATKRIRQSNKWNAKDIPIIAMTANAFAEDKIAALDAGMNEHIAKPLDIQLLVHTIVNLTSK